ncbi:tRNA (adenosine(37)-N6)-dimethylallyltransferase MiaA [Bogoriella caseilytica]|uniref:tRNA dimethylallyltransferase n=1 Tax=Bogoriella caseilytica TaxID=56055 RepID=A0A3N2B9D2_9MICO|nr:tRNA (adenosine(37)-N6)-dimethylallyltransferase MiaA [Bogoriella caseilytica]ROR71867.1 tRNA dimethylallyltransferase [Bogoriella caseilytica]
MEAPPLIAVVGPTASGKSELALDLVDHLGGPEAAEIVSADAMQLYRGMDIGTAKVPLADRRGIAHHQIDVLDVRDEASVAAYQREARADVAHIRARGRIPVLAGGSGLYLRAVLDQLEFPGTDTAIRAELEARAETVGGPALHAELRAADPEAAASIDARNVRRTIRALEVVQLTGRPFSASLPTYTYALPAIQLGLQVPREELDRRITARATQMMDDGLLQETEGLLASGLAEGRTASGAVGYSQAIDVLAGRLSVAEGTHAIALATRQLARRQIKWFRRDPRIHWLPAGEGPGPQLLRSAVAALDDRDEA